MLKPIPVERDRGAGVAFRLRTACMVVSAAVGAHAVPAAAQDWSGGAMNPATVSGPMATQAAAEAQASRRGTARRQVKGSPAQSRRICADARRKADAGDDTPRLARLLALCAKGRY